MKLIVKYVAFISLAISSWITLAQTIVRIAPPARSILVWSEGRLSADTFGLKATNAGTEKDTCG